MKHNSKSKVGGIRKRFLVFTLAFLTLFIFTNLVSAQLGLSDSNKPKLQAPEPSNIVIEINDSTLNVNNSDTVDNYHASAFAKLNEDNTFTGTNHFNNLQTNDNNNIYLYDDEIGYSYIGDNDITSILYGNGIKFQPYMEDYFYMYNGNNYYYKNIIPQDGANITATYLKGNGSLLTGVCLSNGTNCQATSSAGMNYTNIHMTNQSNKDFGVQAIALDNNYMLNISYENGTTQIPAYTNTGGSGDRRSTITLTTTFSMAGTVNKLIDGVKPSSDPYFYADATPTGKYLRFDFGAGATKLITGFKWYQDLGFSHAWMVVQGSNDASTWTNVSTAPFRLGGATIQTVNFATNTNTYRYYQILAINNTYGMSNSPYTDEIEFNISDGATGYRGKIQTYTTNGATAGGVISLQENGGFVTIGKNATTSYALDVEGTINSSNMNTNVLTASQARTILNTTGNVNFNNYNITNIQLLKTGTTADSAFGTYPKGIFSYYYQTAIPTETTSGQLFQTVVAYSNVSRTTVGTTMAVSTDYNSQNHATLRGMGLQFTHFGTGTVTEGTGGIFIVQNVGGGNVTYGYGGRFYMQNTAGRMDNMYGTYISAPLTTTSSTTTNAYGVYVDFINQTNVTNAYGVYQAGGADKNIFAGKTKFGSTAIPTQAVDVAGNVLVSGNITAANGFIGNTTSNVTISNGVVSATRNVLVSGNITAANGFIGNTTSNVTISNGVYQAGAQDRNYFAGHTTFGNTTANVSIDPLNGIRLQGTATVYNDVVAPLTTSKIGATTPSFDENQKAYGFADGVSEQYAFVSLQLPHSYKPSSNIYCHIHVRPDGTQKNNVTFELNYSWYNLGEPSTTTQGLITVSQNFTSGVALNNTIIDFGGITGTNKRESSTVAIKLTRKSNVASDTYTGSVYVDFLDCHHEMEKLGTNNEYT